MILSQFLFKKYQWVASSGQNLFMILKGSTASIERFSFSKKVVDCISEKQNWGGVTLFGDVKIFSYRSLDDNLPISLKIDDDTDCFDGILFTGYVLMETEYYSAYMIGIRPEFNGFFLINSKDFSVCHEFQMPEFRLVSGNRFIAISETQFLFKLNNSRELSLYEITPELESPKKLWNVDLYEMHAEKHLEEVKNKPFFIYRLFYDRNIVIAEITHRWFVVHCRQTGKFLWEHHTEDFGLLSLAIQDGKIYSLTSVYTGYQPGNRHIYEIFDTVSGDLLYQEVTLLDHFAKTYTNAVVHEGFFIVSASGGYPELHFFDLKTGLLAISFPMHELASMSAGSNLIVEGNWIIMRGGHLGLYELDYAAIRTAFDEKHGGHAMTDA